MSRVILESPRPAPPEPGLDASQLAVLAHAADPGAGHAVVVGPAGSGKTTVAVAAAAEAVRSGSLAPDRVLVLAPTRRAASSLRDRVSAAMAAPTAVPPARTAASWAFAVLRSVADAEGMPRPHLISGPEQDVVLRELLAGHRAGHGSAPDWEGIVPPEATALSGFRRELRDLIMRASEAGLGPEELAELGRRSGRPEWVQAAKVFQEYEQVMALRSTPADQGARYDPAAVVAAAAAALGEWPVTAADAGPRWSLILVDDAHDVTRATIGLLGVAADRGARVILLGNADESVQGYRGAVPTFLADATAPAPRGWGATLLRLEGSHRQPPHLAAFGAVVAERIGVSGIGSARVAPPALDGVAAPPVEVIRATTRAAQARAVAARLRARHLGLQGASVPWPRMVVIARSSARLREVRSDLAAAAIPCEPLGEGVALHREPAVAPLLAIVRVALGELWTAESALEVLTSRVIGLDAAGLRRLRRALVREERAGGGTRGGVELLLDSLGDPARLATIEGRDAGRAMLVARAVADAAASRRTPESMLWAAWARLGVAEAWRDGALAGSDRDDADLDAVIAVLRAAEDFTARLPEAEPVAFFAYLAAQGFAADTLAPTGRDGEGVAFATPAAAAGREWDVVVIAGLEEGLWPNLRLRDSVLGAQALAEILAGRSEAAPVPEARRPEVVASARAAVLNDETRAFLVGVTRARSEVIVLTLDGADGASEERPSRYVAWLEAAGATVLRAEEVGGASDLRDAVGALRRDALALGLSERAGHAEMLGHLAMAGVPGADPRRWSGARARSSDAPLWEPDASVTVSPSKVETAETCALKWALESSGGAGAAGPAQLVGSLVHEIAAELPAGSLAEYERALDARWPEIGSLDTGVGRLARARASSMVQRLAGYVARVAADEVRTEVPFRAEIGRAVLQGRADRLHVTGDRAVVADLKTGGRALPPLEAATNAQLAMYQLAASSGGFEGVASAAGAELVYVGVDAVSATVRSQEPVDVGVVAARLRDVVEQMAASGFEARLGPQCDYCSVRRCCPAQPEGAEVSGS
jgi:superfamily I DNA/RNA helicase